MTTSNKTDPLLSRRMRLYHQLDKQFYKNALKTSNQLLTAAQQDSQPFDSTLFETHIKLLTVLDRFEDALVHLSTYHRDQTSSSGDYHDHQSMIALKLLESYCLYKTLKFQDALKVLSDLAIGLDEVLIRRAKMALESQIFFKLERYEEAKANLEELLLDCEPSHPEYLDLTANLAACQARLHFVEHTIPSQIASIDILQLESTPITSAFFHAHAHFPPPPRSRPVRALTQQEPARISKPLDPTRPPPDPERWLPRRDKLRPSKTINNSKSSKSKRMNAALKLKAKNKLSTQGSVSSSTAVPTTTDPSSRNRKQQQASRKKKSKK